MSAAPAIRRPTLADLILAAKPGASIMDRRWLDRANTTLRTAKRFVLDAQAAAYLGDMIRRHPRIVADAQDFAIPPFRQMWVELPLPPFYRAVTGQASDDTGDRTVGYLFNGPTVTVGSESWTGGRYEAGWGPAEYTLHHPLTMQQELRLADQLHLSRAGLDLWYWGATAAAFTGGATWLSEGEVAALDATPDSDWNAAGLRALRANHGAALAPIRPVYASQMAAHGQRLTMGSGGDLRNIVALLLFLNRTADIQYQTEAGMAQGLVRRQPRPLLPHRTITIKLDPEPRLRVLSAGSGIRKRLHDVRGHYKHNRLARESGCAHGVELTGEWGEWWTETDVLRWTCTGCGGKRWWQPEHHRGSADVGIIREQTYAVRE
jgi:hypothetical protein